MYLAWDRENNVVSQEMNETRDRGDVRARIARVEDYGAHDKD